MLTKVLGHDGHVEHDEQPSLDSDDLAKRMEWIDSWSRRNLPAGLLEDLSGFEARHLRLFEDKLGRLLDQSWVQFAALTQLVDQLNFANRDWHPNRSVQFALLAHNLKSFVSALDRLPRDTRRTR